MTKFKHKKCFSFILNNYTNTNFKKDCYNKIGTKLLSDWSY